MRYTARALQAKEVLVNALFFMSLASVVPIYAFLLAAWIWPAAIPALFSLGLRAGFVLACAGTSVIALHLTEPWDCKVLLFLTAGAVATNLTYGMGGWCPPLTRAWPASGKCGEVAAAIVVAAAVSAAGGVALLLDQKAQSKKLEAELKLLLGQ